MLPMMFLVHVASCTLHVAHGTLFTALCARHGRRRHGRVPHARRMHPASCTVRVAWCVGRTAHLRRSALPQGMLRDARRPGLWHACGAYSCIPNGAAHGEGGLLPSAFAERECAARLCSGISWWCASPSGRQCHVRGCDDVQRFRTRWLWPIR
jgi:hypothetical protein